MYFLVEGETEKLYLEWLAAKITAASDRFRVMFRIAVHSSPDSCVKRFGLAEGDRVYALLDYESTDSAHEEAFRGRLRAMRRTADRTGVQFILGYTNYAFELWLILHRISFTRPVYHRRDYLSYINIAFHTSFRSMHNYKNRGSLRRLLSGLTLDDVTGALQRACAIHAECRRIGATLLTFEGFRYYRHDPSLSVDGVVADILQRAGLGGFLPD